MFKKLLRAATLSVAALAATVGASAQAAETINFGIISTEAAINLKKSWDPFLKVMARGTGLDIRGFYASDYAGVIEAMRFNKVQVAWYGNKSAMEAVDRAKGEIFAQTVDVDGNPGYWSLIITHRDKPFAKLDDILKCDHKLNFGIGDPNSTSGFLVPTTYIFAARNIDYKACFKTVRSASHEANAMAVANKLVDAATNNTESMRRLKETNPAAYARIKVLWKSPLIPSDPLVWRKDLDKSIKEKIFFWLMSYGRTGTPEEMSKARKILAALQWAPFVPSSNAQLYPIRILAANKKINKIKASEHLSKEEKMKCLSRWFRCDQHFVGHRCAPHRDFQ